MTRKRTNSKNKAVRVRKNLTKKPAKRNTTSSKASRKTIKLIREIILFVLLVVSLFVLISVLFGIGGKLGLSIRNLLFGLFGIGAYLIPIFFTIVIPYKLFLQNKDNRLVTNNKFSLAFILIMQVPIFAHIFSMQSAQINKTPGGEKIFFKAMYLYYDASRASKAFGGLVGGFLGDTLFMLLGRIGSILLLALICIVIAILITEKSFVNAIKWTGSKVKSVSSGAIEKTKAGIDKKKQKKAKRVDDAFSRIAEAEENSKSKEYDIIITNDGSGEQEVDAGVVQWEKAEDNSEPNLEVVKTTSGKKESKPEKVETDSSANDNVTEKIKTSRKISGYSKPPIELLSLPSDNKKFSRSEVESKANKLVETLESFGVDVTLLDVRVGPSVTRYELQPNVGVKVSKVVNLQDDIALALASGGIRIEAPIPGKSAIGIEVPNDSGSTVPLRRVIESREFKNHYSNIAVALGVDIAGEKVIADISKMPHLLIAGATGSGKSVCINTLIISILYKANPNDVKLLLIDPKVVELSVYNNIPHLLVPVVTDARKAALSLNWAVNEMTNRYKMFADANVRDIKGYNKWAQSEEGILKLPQIVIIVDELADLMMVSPAEVEEAIIRLAQMARAAGIHLIIATQRPSVDVITGLIKANIPSRIAFSVSSGVDSRTILDSVGAEKLLGKGDMLFSPVGVNKPIRIQGAFVSDKEVKKIVSHVKIKEIEYDEEVVDSINNTNESSGSANRLVEKDEYFDQAVRLVIEKDKASASMLQRYFRIGYNRAARLLDQLYEAGVVSKEDGSKARDVLMTLSQYEESKGE